MSIFSIGVSGLNTAQLALGTTSNNITNVYTPGYNRQLTLLGESGVGSGVGSGVQVNGIQRQFSQFVAGQLNQANSSSSALSAYNVQVGQIDNLLADSKAGLAPLLQSFFSSLQDLAATPSDPASRQGVIGSADTLTAQFRAFDGYLHDMQQGINGQIEDEVFQINNMAEQMAMLNREISLAKAKTGEAPNSLLDQRDQLVADLSSRIDVRLTVQDGGTYNLSVGNGQALVAGTNSFELVATPSAADPTRTAVGYVDGAGNTLEFSETTFSGGTLGGLMTFRRETLDKTQNQVGQIAVSLAQGFNEQHRLGQDLNGEQGADFFAIGQPLAFANANNALGSAQIVATAFGDMRQLEATDYSVRVKDATPTFEVVRKDNGEAVAFEYDSAAKELSFGGVVLGFDGGSFTAGDRFEVQPVRRAGSGLDVAIGELDQVAAGNFLDVGGDMSIEGLSADGGAMSGSPAGGYSLTLAADGTLTTSGGTIERNGQAMNLAIDKVVAGDELMLDGVRFTVEALPASGSATLTLKEAAFGSGDNRNALALQGLQSKALVGGVATLNQSYAAMVGDVGNRANVVKANLAAQDGLTEQLSALQQSESGVNLDEEAANLLRFQQYYQASAKIIEVGTSVIDTLLGLRT